MDMSQLSLFRMARQKMGWLGARQSVLSQNIANANTPGYRSKEIEALDFSRELSRIRQINLAGTNGSHLSGTVVKPDHRVDESRLKDVYEVNPDGNSVIMEEQVMKVAENQMQHQLTSSIYKKHMQMMRMALSEPGRG
ncbi:MAG: flagellar basal body rod protein FlgB [Alphaproteobacteria bacterium]|nr:flagellar basal body rod protein FlgB [Alphaproteobacteria bacterium]